MPIGTLDAELVVWVMRGSVIEKPAVPSTVGEAVGEMVVGAPVVGVEVGAKVRTGAGGGGGDGGEGGGANEGMITPRPATIVVAGLVELVVVSCTVPSIVVGLKNPGTNSITTLAKSNSPVAPPLKLPVISMVPGLVAKSHVNVCWLTAPAWLQLRIMIPSEV